MAARVARHMSLARASIIVFVVVALLTTLFMIKLSQGQAAPTSPTDESKVPHYFGPWPNWALSPLTLPDATVTINGDGTGALATATVGGNGVVTGINIVDPGSGYTNATVSITGAGTGAAATATITNTGAIVAIDVTTNGSHYKSPVVAISGGGATTDATASAYGGVDSITVQNAGTGYKFPTVDFDMPDDPNGVKAEGSVQTDANGAVTGITITKAGSGYMTAPNVVIRDGTLLDPIANGGAGASAVATIDVQTVVPDTFGAGYTSAPTVSITDAVGNGSGATATARVDNGLVSSIAVTAPGSGYVTPGGIKKFQDQLPVLCDPASQAGCPTPATAKFLPIGVPEEKTYNDPNGKPIKSDEYEIGLIQFRTKFNTDLPPTLVRAYVQLESPSWLAAHPGVSQHVPLENELLNGTKVPVMINGQQAYGVTTPQWLGPVLAATKDKPVRIVFRNLLPTGADGDLFLPTDSTLMGSGMGPMGLADPVDEGTVLDGVRNQVCTEAPKSPDCFKDNRATLHLHGGISPWISDGTPHQWITPANEDTPWPEGVDVRYVPDMPVGNDPRDGVMTFYYTNQQSARLMFYHDHAWGITRLNVYAGEAAGYLISDDTEKALINSGTVPADQIPLIVQDRTFVPQDSQMYDVDGAGNVYGTPGFNPQANGIKSYGQDPTWDKTRWGKYGDFWYHHVYMPAQNPGDPGGLSAYGRWMYGPWFWPPAAATKYGPIDNPYYNPNCKLDDPTTWTYQTDPFCEPQKIPGTPNISAGMEQFNDTPIVNGVAYPEITLQPKSYRFRVLNAANDRFFNFQWYVADPSTGTDSEVALDPLLLAQAQTDPVVFPTPVHNASTDGPDWIQIGTEGGFLPAPVVVNGQQETTWITDPTRFDVGNVDKHSLLLAPAERADVIVDFSKFAGKTLIMYNDAPAAFPARVPSYDYYTGQPDLSPNGPSVVLPGYGPNTRTVMRVKIAAAAPAPAFNLTKLRNAFSHKVDGSGVFESSQHPIIVGQAAYNSAYGTAFPGGSDCNSNGSTLQICDGFVRVNDTAQFGFNTLQKPTTKTTLPLQPKAIHDEMNATTFDEFGRMQANLGVEAQPPTPGLQNVTLYPFVNPATEFIDGTNLPKNDVLYDANGNPVSDVKILPLSNPNDGTQIWRVTHNGVDTHPIHFHLYDVQLLNRVTWDNIIIPPDKEELGWKDTVRMAPLEDTIVALRPIVPEVPWEVANSIRNLNPMEPAGSTKLFNNIDPQGNPTAAITNQLVNYGWMYVWHCHILSHEEMDMMRPQSLVLPPVAPSGLTNTLSGTGTQRRAVLTWNDNSITETAFRVQRSTNLGSTWTTIATINSPLSQANIHQTRTYTDTSTFNPSTTTRYYRVLADNTAGYVADPAFPQMTATSNSNTRVVGPQYTITASAGTGGAITPSGAVAVGRGASQTFTFTPDPQYRISQVLVNGVNNATAVSTGTYTFTNVQSNQTIAVSFTQSAVTITSSAGAGGSISPNGATTVPVGGTMTYTITPNKGYTVNQVLVDGVNNPGAVQGGTYTFTNVTANHTIVATFTRVTATITASAGGGGSISPSGQQTVAVGGSQSYTIAPNAQYVIDTVLVDGVNDPAAVTAGSYTFTNVTADHTIRATFRLNNFTITPSADANSTITPNTVQAVAPGGSQTFTMGAAVGYHILDVLVDGVSVGPQTTYTFNNVAANHTIAVSSVNTPIITPSAGANGTISPSVPTAVAYGGSQAFSITPDAGSYITDVKADGFSVGPVASYAFTNVTANHTIAATFAVNAISVTAPTAASSFVQGSSTNVTWSTLSPVASGEFIVFLRDAAGNWYGGTIVPANFTTNYSQTVILHEPAGTGYYASVYYRQNAVSPWINNAVSGAFDITSAGPTITVTAPAGGPYLQGSVQTATWTTNGPVATGEFIVFVRNSVGAWFGGTTVAADGTASYSQALTLHEPVDTGYYATVYWRATVGSGGWINGAVGPTFAIN